LSVVKWHKNSIHHILPLSHNVYPSTDNGLLCHQMTTLFHFSEMYSNTAKSFHTHTNVICVHMMHLKFQMYQRSISYFPVTS